ncbi:MAG: DUF4175 domain-containing protein [Saprospiraceae bacterium]|nr:DUF4175 domain-containing protein [Saprospiraceae bacterium]
MAWNENYYDQLILKIDQFTRKYYINQLIKGSLYFTGLVTLVFLAYNLLENQFYFSKGVRTFLSLSYLVLFASSLWYWVASPLLHYFRLGKLISHEEAAKIIGSQFGDVKDKLLNVLQLKTQSVNYSDRSLIDASIQQKSIELTPVPFVQAIDLQKNRKYLQYAIAPLFLLGAILVWAPGMIQKPTQRLISINKDFEKEAPFHFKIEADALHVEQNGDFTLEIKIDGSALPADAFIDVDNFQYRLKKESQDLFTYTFNNVQKDLPFKLFSGAIQSPEYTLKVLMKPVINSFQVRLEYPTYTGRKNETLENTGDLIIPVGTKVNWYFNSEYTDHLYFKSLEDKEKAELQRKGENEFQYSRKILKDQSYTLFLKNNFLSNLDSVQYQMSVIPDQYPQIQLEAFSDSSDYKVNYYAGQASDDYGIRNITFNSIRLKKDGSEEAVKSVVLNNLTPGKSNSFSYSFDAAEYNLAPGEAIRYYFEVWDNDAINGSKSSRSQYLEYKEASLEELAKLEEHNNEEIKDDLEEALAQAKKLQEKLNDYKDKMRQKKDLDWQNKKDLEKMIQQQEQIQKKFEDAQKKLDENLKKQKNEDENLQNKQEQLQKLFKETANEEMKKLMQQIQNLMNEMNKDQAIQMSEQFENKNADMSKEMDRLLQLFKQLEVEKNLKDQIKELNKLAEKQEALSEKTEKKEEQQDDLKKQQEDIHKKFDELAKKQEEIKKKNEELKTPRTIEDTKKEESEIKQDLKDSKEELNNSKNEKASKKQKDAAGKMKEMANKMEKEMEESDQEQAEEDAKMLRQLLENLVGLSFDQERVVNEMANLNLQTPRYLGLLQDQFKIKDNFKIVQDTLEVLSQRLVEIQSFVMEKVNEINDNFKIGLELLEDRRSGEASNNQGRVMKNLNDLAVMLSESLDEKQKECNGGSCNKPGKKACKKPGSKGGGKQAKSGKVPSDKISQGQKTLEKGMQEMLQKMKDGKQGSSKEFAEMAAKQAKLRKMLQDLEEEKKESGNGTKQAQEILDEMNNQEKQLVNKQLTNEMLKRQQEITTRLLDAEKADRERDWDEKRKSQTGTNIVRKLPPGLEAYIKQRQAETEWFKQVSPELRPFYKKLVEQYYQSLRK